MLRLKNILLSFIQDGSFGLLHCNEKYREWTILENNIGKRNQSQSITIEIIQAAYFAALPIFHFIMLSNLEGHRPKSRSVILISNLLFFIKSKFYLKFIL